MATPARAPTIVPNVSIPNTLTLTEQFQEWFYQVKQLLVAAGGTVIWSNGNGISTTNQSQLFLVPASPNNSTLYRIILNGTNNNFTTDASATQAELRDGMITQINTNMSALGVAVASGNNILFTSFYPTAFTHSVAAGPGSPITESTAVSFANADNLPNRAAVTTGLAGAGASYLIEYTNLGGSPVRFLINVNDASAPIQAIQHRGGNAVWDTSNANTTTLPIVSSGFAYASVAVAAFMPFTTGRNMRYSTWLSTTGGTGAKYARAILKEEGATVESGVCFVVLEANTDVSGGGIGVNRWKLAFFSAMTSGILNGGGGIPFSGVGPSGVASENGSSANALWDLAVNYTAGINTGGTADFQGLVLGVNAAAGRLLGAWVDMYAIPQNSTSFIYTNTAEAAQAQQLMNFGDAAMFWPASTAVS